MQPTGGPGPRRLCISRRDFEPSTRSVHRVFGARETLERLAVARGYAMVQPERLDLAAQIALFAGAECIVGEYGSGRHNAIIAPAGAVCGYVTLTNSIQIRIGQAFGQTSVVIEDAPMTPRADGALTYTAVTRDLDALLTRMDEV